MSKKVIELFYDVVSPYSWLGFEVLCRYRNVWNMELKFRPAFLGGVMHDSGNKPPAMVPNKGLYMMKDLTRLASFMNIPLRHPADPFEVMFEKGSLPAMRFLTAIAEKEKDGSRLVEKVSRELWKRIWSTDQDICEPASLSEAGLKAGLSSGEVEELLSLAKSQPIKDKRLSVFLRRRSGFLSSSATSMENLSRFSDRTDSSSLLTASEKSGTVHNPTSSPHIFNTMFEALFQ